MVSGHIDDTCLVTLIKVRIPGLLLQLHRSTELLGLILEYFKSKDLQPMSYLYQRIWGSNPRHCMADFDHRQSLLLLLSIKKSISRFALLTGPMINTSVLIDRVQNKTEPLDNKPSAAKKNITAPSSVNPREKCPEAKA